MKLIGKLTYVRASYSEPNTLTCRVRLTPAEFKRALADLNVESSKDRHAPKGVTVEMTRKGAA